jgi:hypothetical protein
MELDRWLWRDEPHVSLKRVWEVFTTYLYMPRLRDESVLLEAIREGLHSRDYFAYANSVTLDRKYQGLQFGSGSGAIYLDAHSVLVKPEAALKQLAAESKLTTPPPPQPPEGNSIREGGPTSQPTPASATITPPRPKRFHGAITLDATRVSRDAGQVAQEVIQHLTSLLGANVEVTLEIHATIPAGAPDATVRTVTENCRTLKFSSHGFETE